MANLTKTTQDHDEIRRWAEERGGKPSHVKSTESSEDIGILRIDFPGFSGEGSLEEISWEDFFGKFDERNLALLYQEETAGGERSNFNKIVSAETAAEADTKSRGRSGGSGAKTGAAAKKSGGAARKSSTTKASAGTARKGSAVKRSGGSAIAKKAVKKATKKAAPKKAAPKKAVKKAPAKKAVKKAVKKAATKKAPAKKAAKKSASNKRR